METKEYVKPGFEKLAIPTLEKKAGDKLKAWDDETEVTWQQILERNFQRIRDDTSPKSSLKWTPLGSKDGVEFERAYEINDNGNGYFRLKGTIPGTPQLLLGLVADPASIGELDPTTAFQRELHKFDDKSLLVHTIANPGFPFAYRDFVDLASWTCDPDGTFYQTAVSVPESYSQHAHCIRGYVMRWGYSMKLISEENGGKTEVVCVSQSALNGWFPSFLTNYFVGPVLADYVVALGKVSQKKIDDGSASDYCVKE